MSGRKAAKRFAGRGISSGLAVIVMAAIWVGLWGDLSWGNIVAGAFLGVLVMWFWPLPKSQEKHLVIRPLAVLRLFGLFVVDVVVASVQIARVVLSRRQPVEAVIRVQTRAHSDYLLAATTGFTSLVPGSIVIDAHRLTGMIYVHLFDIGDDPDALAKAHRQVIRQEERILRAFASDEQLRDAGYQPGWSMKAGRLSATEIAEHRSRVLGDLGQETK